MMTLNSHGFGRDLNLALKTLGNEKVDHAKTQ